MREFLFDSEGNLTVKTTVEGEEGETVQTISADQLVKHLPMFFVEMPVDLVMQAHAIVAALPR